MIYLLLGLGFIWLSIFLFRRLPNSKKASYRWLALSILFGAAGVGAAYHHVSSFMEAAAKRQLYTEVNNRYVNTPKMVIDRYDIDLKQHPRTISTEVELRGVALERASVFTFSLNPGLVVSEVSENNKPLTFTRDHQIVLIDFGRAVEPGDSIRFTMNYSGSIDEGFSYLDIPTEILEEEHASSMFKIDKKYSFQDENYVLFTPETYWYPRPGTSYSSENPDWQQAYFSHFRLKVTTINNLKALSQGTMKWPIVSRGTRPEERQGERVSAERRPEGRQGERAAGERRPEGRQGERVSGERRPEGSPEGRSPRGERAERRVPRGESPEGRRPVGERMDSVGRG